MALIPSFTMFNFIGNRFTYSFSKLGFSDTFQTSHDQVNLYFLEFLSFSNLFVIKIELKLHILTFLAVTKSPIVLAISLMYQNLNLQFTCPLSHLASVLPLMLPLFGIHFLKTFVHHPLLPLLERSSKPISTQRHILLSSFSLMASSWC